MKFKLLKEIKNVDWKVGEVKEVSRDGRIYNPRGNSHIVPTTIALLEATCFIEEVDETPKRWRNGKQGYYYFISEGIEAIEDRDYFYVVDNIRYNAGNYFQTREQAQAMADKFKGR